MAPAGMSNKIPNYPGLPRWIPVRWCSNVIQTAPISLKNGNSEGKMKRIPSGLLRFYSTY
jgi:hypothetical protein